MLTKNALTPVILHGNGSNCRKCRVYVPQKITTEKKQYGKLVGGRPTHLLCSLSLSCLTHVAVSNYHFTPYLRRYFPIRTHSCRRSFGFCRALLPMLFTSIYSRLVVQGQNTLSVQRPHKPVFFYLRFCCSASVTQKFGTFCFILSLLIAFIRFGTLRLWQASLLSFVFRFL